MRKPTETADWSSCEIMDSGTTAGEPTLYLTWPSTCGWQFCSLVCLWDPQQSDQDLSLMHKLTFWSPFLRVGYLAQPGCSGEGLGPVSIWCAKLCWISMEGFTLYEEWMGDWSEGKRRVRGDCDWYLKWSKNF